MYDYLFESQDIPVYMQIAKCFGEDILSGKLKPGERLPSVRRLACKLDISVITVTHAYDELKKQGLLVVQKGKGHFVCLPDSGAIEEQRIRRVEVHLLNAISTGRMAGCTDLEIKEACLKLLEV